MPHIPKCFCVSCDKEMRPHQTGVMLEVQLDTGSPYYKIMADLYKCPICKTVVATGMARSPLVEHFDTENYNNVIHTETVRLGR